MKRIAYVGFAGVILAGMLVTSAGAQSEPLGDYARAARKEKKPPAGKQYDNDNLPRTDKLSVVGHPTEEPSQPIGGEAAAEAQAAQAADQPQPTAQPSPSADEQQKAYADWKQKIAAQKGKVELASRELDVQQREYRLRAAAMYADAGNRLRNSGSWDKEDAQYKQQIADKQKAADAAKKELEGLQEQARKAGVPNSVRQ